MKSSLDFLGKGGFILCTKGRAEVHALESEHQIERGHIFLTTPLVNVISLECSEDFEYISFLDDIKVFYPVFRIIADTGIPMAVRQRPCWKVDEQLFLFIMSQKKRLTDKLQDKELTDNERILCSSHCDLIRQETMLEVLITRFKGSADMEEEHNRLNMITYQFILNLHENYARHRDVLWYAQQAGLSAGYFADIIRKVTGLAPSKWISTITVTYIKIMLEKTDNSIKEIAATFGFPEQFTFRKYFKNATGISPSDYRKPRQKV